MINKTFIAIISSLTLGIIILLTLKWINFYKDMKSVKIPPWKNKCPDYWLMEEGGKCRNIHQLGKCALEEGGVIDFSKSPFIGVNGDKNKCQVAKSCNIPWTGIDDKCV